MESCAWNGKGDTLVFVKRCLYKIKRKKRSHKIKHTTVSSYFRKKYSWFSEYEEGNTIQHDDSFFLSDWMVRNCSILNCYLTQSRITCEESLNRLSKTGWTVGIQVGDYLMLVAVGRAGGTTHCKRTENWAEHKHSHTGVFALSSWLRMWQDQLLQAPALWFPCYEELAVA